MRAEAARVEAVMLDACCTLNLAATGRIQEILQQLPYRFCMGRRARAEAQWLRIPGEGERERVELQPLIEIGLLEEELLQSREEEALFVEFGVQLADGEAEAAALAVRRGYALATDDRKARRVVAEHGSGLRLIGTLELLREWQLKGAVPDAAMAEALLRVAERATYRPRRSHPLWEWWAALVEE